MARELHKLETINGKVAMAWAGDTPWHGLGTKVPNDLTPVQMLEAASLNWTVNPVPLVANVNGLEIPTGHRALVRDIDNKVIDVVTNDWNPVQNIEAFEFFNDFVAAGDMEMHTAGSLRDGQIVWALAKINDGFELFGGRDRIDNYLLFTNPHTYGRSIDVRVTSIRAVCMNTLTMAVNSKSNNVVKVSHRVVFDADEVKTTLGVARQKLAKYREVAEYLSTKRAKEEDVVEYFKRVFPALGSGEKAMSKSATRALEYMESQPGAEFGRGTWWQSLNAVTYFVDHKAGRTDDSRLTSAWYGQGRQTKLRAVELALEMAN